MRRADRRVRGEKSAHATIKKNARAVNFVLQPFLRKGRANCEADIIEMMIFAIIWRFFIVVPCAFVQSA
jgi:hypothetical protein